MFQDSDRNHSQQAQQFYRELHSSQPIAASPILTDADRYRTHQQNTPLGGRAPQPTSTPSSTGSGAAWKPMTETKMSVTDLAQQMGNSNTNIVVQGNKDAKIDFKKLDPSMFAKYVLYYRPSSECGYSANIERILSQHPEIEHDFVKVNVNEVDKNWLRSQGVRGTPSVLTDRTQPGVTPLLGDDALKWLSRIFAETIRPCAIGEADNMCSSSLDSFGSCVVTSTSSTLAPSTASLQGNLAINSDETLDSIDGSAVLASDRTNLTREMSTISQQWRQK